MYVAHHATAAAHRRPDRARLRLRLDPARPRRLLHRPAARGERAGHAARRRPRQRHVLRRHLPLRDDGDVAGPADEGGVGRAGAGSSRGPRAAPRGPSPASRTATRVLGCWLLPLPTIDPFVVARSGAALASYGPKFRYSHYAGTKTLRYAAGGAVGVGALAAGGAGQAAAQPAARAGSSRARARRAPAREVVVHRRLRRRGRRPHRPHPGLRRRPRLRRDREDARRVRAVPGLRRQPGRPPARSPPPRRWATTCSPGCRRGESASRWCA